MKILVAPDSFKGSLSAPEAAAAMARGVLRVHPHAQVVSLPLADGGEGTLDALLAATGGHRVECRVSGPLGEPMQASFGLLGTDGKTAVVEMAQAAGLGLVPSDQRDPRVTSTYGVGELLLAAAGTGVREIIVGLGGSATNDGGAGALQAMGVQFLDAAGRALPDGLGGSALTQIARIATSKFRFPVGQVQITIASDVTNPLLGPQGASAIYGPQKGADAAAVRELDAALAHYADLVRRDVGRDVAGLPGAGAAGGLGAGLMAFLGAQMRSGIDLVLDAVGFDAHLAGADWVLTGEGRLDAQTAQGKVIAGVLARCACAGVPLIAFGGSVDEAGAAILYQRGLQAAFPIVSGPMTVEEAMRDGARLLEDAVARVTRLLDRSL